MKMTAAMLYAPRDIRVETREVPACGEHDVIINLKKACLCPTDIKKYDAAKPDVEGALKEYGPCILGHEAAGVIVEVGAAVLRPLSLLQRRPDQSLPRCYWCGLQRRRVQRL